MTNVSETPEKVELRAKLVRIGIHAVQAAGWSVEKVPGFGKSSVRRLRKDGKSLLASIRTTQDLHIAFPRDKEDKNWITLSDVDVVVAVSVDDKDNPRFALVHMLDAEEMRDRFDRTYAARLAAGHTIPIGRGVWLSLYIPESKDIPAHVGAGAGLKHPPIARIPLDQPEDASLPRSAASDIASDDKDMLTIAEAKRRLAKSLGVDASSIKITVEA